MRGKIYLHVLYAIHWVYRNAICYIQMLYDNTVLLHVQCTVHWLARLNYCMHRIGFTFTDGKKLH